MRYITMDVEYGFIGVGRSPNYELYGELNGLQIYISQHKGVLTHVRFKTVGPLRFVIPAYTVAGALSALAAPDKHAAAAIAFIFLAGAPFVRQVHRARIIKRITDIASQKNDEYSTTIRLMAGYFSRF